MIQNQYKENNMKILEKIDLYLTEQEKGYKEFFNKMLKKYGVDEPDKLPDDKKKAFYNEIDKGWKAKKETD